MGGNNFTIRICGLIFACITGILFNNQLHAKNAPWGRDAEFNRSIATTNELILSPYKYEVDAHDSIILKNGDVIVGEIKSMDKGVLTIETDYSKSDITIKWSGIKEIYSTSHFMIT